MKINASLKISPRNGERSVYRLRSDTSLSQLCAIVLIGILYFVFVTPMQKSSIRSSIHDSSAVIQNEFETVDAHDIGKLAFVSLPYHNACNSNGEKVSCQTTILFDANVAIPLRNVSDSTLQESVCTQVGASTTPFVQVPVCVQNADGFGALVYAAPAANVVVVVQSTHDKSVQEFVNQHVPDEARVVDLKKLDFPDNYKRVDDIKNLVWERFRDDNYGNMVWRYSASMILNPVTVQFDRSDRHSNLELQDGPADVLVIATANTLHITRRPILKDFVEGLTRRITTRNVSTIVIGLGIQMEFDNKHLTAGEDAIQESLVKTKEKLPHSFQTDFLEQASIRQNIPSIGVRGDMTRKVCENSGINNCVPMGCPSLSISRNINLGRTLEENWVNVLRRLKNRDRTLKIAVTSPASVGKIIDMCRLAMAYIFDSFGDHATLIEQAPLDWPKLKNFTEQKWPSIRPMSQMTSDSINHVEFYNVESWLASAQEYDLCISFRIHGSMMFLNPGVPTVLIPTDFRIMELISSMKIPHVAPSELQTAMDANFNYFQQANPDAGFEFLESLMNIAKNTNFTDFEVNRREKLTGWKTILNNVGLEMDPALERVIDSPLEMQ